MNLKAVKFPEYLAYLQSREKFLYSEEKLADGDTLIKHTDRQGIIRAQRVDKSHRNDPNKPTLYAIAQEATII